MFEGAKKRIRIARYAVLMLATSSMLSGCGSSAGQLRQDIRASGAEIGRAVAPISIPDDPPHCGAAVPHTNLLGTESPWIAIASAEGEQLNFANQRAANCAAYRARLKYCLERGIVDSAALEACAPQTPTPKRQ